MNRQFENKFYNEYSVFLKNKYKEKVYKIPINLDVSCPNRILKINNSNFTGCTFCNGVGFEMLSNKLSVTNQLIENINYISPKYKAKKFIAYFQNYTNTYMPLEKFKNYIEEIGKISKQYNVVGISISTRPDSINKYYLDILKNISNTYNLDIDIELGLQSVNYKTLKKINRGHSLAEYIESSFLIKSYGFYLSTHMILNLPYDDLEDVIEGAKIISSVKSDFVKMHSLYIQKNTYLAEEFLKNNINLKTLDDYIEKAANFLAYLDPNIVVQRLVSRSPKEDTLFCNYNVSWWKIKDMIIEFMEENNLYQGKFFNYLGGNKVKKFTENI